VFGSVSQDSTPPRVARWFFLVTAQINTLHCSGFVQMGKRSFEKFPALTEQALAPLFANPPTVTIHGVLRLVVIPPVSPPPVRLVAVQGADQGDTTTSKKDAD
jgi:hypothetical protein